MERFSIDWVDSHSIIPLFPVNFNHTNQSLVVIIYTIYSFYANVGVCARFVNPNTSVTSSSTSISSSSISSRFFVVALGGKYKRGKLMLCEIQSFSTFQSG